MKKKLPEPAKKETVGVEQYIKLPAILIRSPSLRNLPLYAFRVVLAVMDEHNKKGGKENGNLAAPHKTLKLWLGISNKRAISLAINQAEALGLIAVARGYVARDGTKVPNRYRLTWLPGHNGHATGDWKDVSSDEHAKAILAELKKPRPQSEKFKSAKAADQLGVGAKWGDNNNKIPRQNSLGIHGGDRQRDFRGVCRYPRG